MKANFIGEQSQMEKGLMVTCTWLLSMVKPISKAVWMNRLGNMTCILANFVNHMKQFDVDGLSWPFPYLQRWPIFRRWHSLVLSFANPASSDCRSQLRNMMSSQFQLVLLKYLDELEASYISRIPALPACSSVLLSDVRKKVRLAADVRWSPHSSFFYHIS